MRQPTFEVMKRIVLLLAVLLLGVTASAQEEKGIFTIQPKLGMNIANYIEGGNTDPRIGLAIGAEGEYRFSRLFSLSVGVIYSQQGDKEEGYLNNVYAKTTDKLDYLNIPLMSNLYVANGLALKLGVQPNFNMSAKYEIEANGMTIGGDYSDQGIDIKSFDLSLPLGLSYEFHNIVIDGRYNLGLTKIVEGYKTKHSVFQITLGYKFRL